MYGGHVDFITKVKGETQYKKVMISIINVSIQYYLDVVMRYFEEIRNFEEKSALVKDKITI